jgi:hypothetical protein
MSEAALSKTRSGPDLDPGSAVELREERRSAAAGLASIVGVRDGTPTPADRPVESVIRNFSKRAIARMRRSWDRRAFERTARGILNTLPLQLRDDSPLFLSMLCHPDVMAYLIAIKSLYLAVGQGQVAVIDDGSLTMKDLAVLHHHIPGIEVLDIAAIPTGACPRGGTWERLVKIMELTATNYVIQVDADTLVSAPIPEVVQCWRNNKPFLLGTNVGQEILPAPYTADMVRNWIKTYNWNVISVGVAAESSLDMLPGADQKSYVHASSGFAGFARGAFKLSDLEWFSTHMEKIIGVECWRQWGSEQIGSNYILANAPGAIVLPFPGYACFEPQLKYGEHAFLHFIGSYRYDSGIYRQRAAKFIPYYKSVTKSCLDLKVPSNTVAS